MLVTGLIVVVPPVAVPAAVGATPVDDQRHEVERIVDQLDALHEQADILAEDYVVALDDKQRLDGEVADALRGQLSAVAVRAFTSTGSDALGPLFSNAGAYNDSLSRDQYSRVALSVGTATTDDLDEAVAALHDERANLDDKRSQAAALTEQIADAKEATEERLGEYEQLRTEAEAKLGELVAEEEQRRLEAAQREMEARVAAARRAQTQAPATGDGDGGGGGGGGGESSGGASARTVAPTPNYPAPSSLAQVAINAALSQQGVPYRFAAASPGEAFDCSGLTMWAWGQAGVGLPHQSRAQAAMLPHVPIEEAQPGDLIFYYSPISHVAIYLGGGQLIHAPATGETVTVAGVNWGKVAVVGRPG
jgi:peptidoglycan DL-endopeptidase CwlO